MRVTYEQCYAGELKPGELFRFSHRSDLILNPWYMSLQVRTEEPLDEGFALEEVYRIKIHDE